MTISSLLLHMSSFHQWTAEAFLEDVPGCKCDATLCGDGSEWNGIDACTFTKQSKPPYLFQNVVIQNEPMCDALEADTDFQETYGDKGIAEGTYYPSGFLSVSITSGTCQDEYTKQNSCNQSYAGKIATSRTLTGKGCGMTTLPMPVTNSSLRVTSTCLSEVDESIASGYDDDLVIYVELGMVGDGDSLEDNFSFSSYYDFLCREEVAARHQPILKGKKDWIEPKKGRRYMCYDFADYNSQAYNVLVMSLGNAPCSGPVITPFPTSAPRDNDYLSSSATTLTGILHEMIMLSMMVLVSFHSS